MAEAAAEAKAVAKAEEGVPEGAAAATDVHEDESTETQRRISVAVSEKGAEAIIKSGFLHKQGGVYKSWRKRFFVLTSNAIAYYTGQTQDELKGGVLLEHVNDVKPAEKFDTTKPHVIAVETPERRYLFQAKDADEMNAWVDAISKAWRKARPMSKTETELAKENRMLKEELASLKDKAPSAGDDSSTDGVSVQASWDNHFAAFGAQDVPKILEDYAPTSQIRVWNHGTKEEKVYNGLDGVKEFFTLLFADLSDTSGLGVGNLFVEEDIGNGCGAVFLVWHCPSSGIAAATDSFYFNQDKKIIRQFIDLTPAALKAASE